MNIDIISPMNVHFVIFMLFVGFVANVPAIASDEPILRSQEDSKIHSILLQWISSDSPEKFALENNIPVKNGKIHVYIHLYNSTDIPTISHQVEVFASYGNVAESYVNKEQLYNLEKLDYVTKITPLVLAKTPPILMTVDKTHTDDLGNQNYYYLILILVTGIVAYFVYKRKKQTKSAAFIS